MAKLTKRNRPFGIIVITIVQTISVIGQVIVLIILQTGDPYAILEGIVSSQQLLVFEILGIIFQAVITIGFWSLKRWAWFLFMIQLGINMAFDLGLYFYGEPYYLGMLRDVIMVFYLNQREVQQVFEHKSPAPEAA